MPIEPRSDKGYLVPDNPSPEDFEYRLIKIPDDPQWRETYSYLVGLLTFGYVWDKDSGDWEAAQNTAMEVLQCFIGLGLDCMTVCEIVADCITNDIETQAAIALAISNSSAIQAAIGGYIQSSGYNTPTGGLNTNASTIQSIGAVSLDSPIGTLDACDNDDMWGAIRFGIVKYLEDNAINFLEDLNTIADKGQRVNAIIGGIPIIGDVLSSTVSQFVEAIPDLLNLFNSYASETTQDNAACEIFQMVCDTCDLPTYRQLIDYYGNLGVTGYDDLSNVAFQLATDLMLGSSTLSGSIVYHTMIAYEIMVLYLGAKFNQAVGIKIIDTWALIGVPFGSNAWIALCDGCGEPVTEWSYYQNFADGVGDWTVLQGTQVASSGVEGETFSGQKNIGVLLNLDASYTWQMAQVKYTRTGGAHGTDSYRMIFWTAYPSSSGRVNHIVTEAENEGTFDKCYDTQLGVNRKQFSIWIEGNDTGQIVLQSIKVWATNSDTPPAPLTDNSVVGCT